MNFLVNSLEKSVNPAEWQARVNLAAFFRLVAAYGWDDLLLAHLSYRVPDEDAYLINPYGLLFKEITASSLLKVNYQGGKLLDHEYDISPEANVIHGAILTARPDINCVAHVHTVAGTAVSSQRAGLKNISQQSMIVSFSLAYHDYEGIVLDLAEAPRLEQDLGDKNHMILRNHGLLTVGSSVSAAFHALYNLQRACEMQVAAEAGGQALIPLSEEMINVSLQRISTMPQSTSSRDLLWEALLRRLRTDEPEFET
jgi:ribulose-5-phosphate 4-epimerase/fuculose-1-phosphate aldolase